MTRTSQPSVVLIMVFMAALLWGIYWLPIRQLEALGMPGAWAGFMLALGALPMLGGLCLWRRRAIPSRRSIIGAVALGGAFSLYAAALVYTDVVRAILIFYMAPAWSLLIEAVFMGRKLGWQSALAVLVSLFGIAMVCRFEIPLDGIGALGDWMALASGVLWSISAAMLFSSRAPDLGQTAFIAMVAAALVSLSVILLDPVGAGVMPAADVLRMAIPFALIFGLVFNGPIILLTIWGAIPLPPATVTFLLTAEIISGVVSSAILLDEPFAGWEVAGTLLITTGALIEILFPPRRAKAKIKN